MLRVILFDLDGTLMDTAPEIADALNATLARFGYPPQPEERVRDWIGDGARVLLGRAMRQAGMPLSWEAQVWAGFAHDYAEHCGRRSRLHEGVRALLQRLRAQGLATALLTNKEAAFTRRLLAGHGLLADFDLLVAGDTLPVKKPHPGVVAHALAALQATPDEALLVGDSVTDVRTARAAGIAVQLVRHGYPGAADGTETPDGWTAHFDDFDPAAAVRVTD